MEILFAIVIVPATAFYFVIKFILDGTFMECHKKIKDGTFWDDLDD